MEFGKRFYQRNLDSISKRLLHSHILHHNQVANVVAFDMYVGFDKMFVAIYVIGLAKLVNTQFGRAARV